jgi:uncharacterized membrane protein
MMPKLKKPRVTEPIEPELARPDWIVVVLALAGLAVAGYLTALKLGGTQAFLCRDGSGCDVVQASRYSVLAGVPTAVWGAAIYLAIAVLAAMPRTARRWQAAFMLASGAVAFSLYLTIISIFVIGATCPYCLASGGIAVALLAAMVWRRPAAQGRQAAAYKPGRLVGLGVTAAVLTVLVGAFIFAADFSVPAGYQSALARHLAKKQAIFYGAYW